MDNDREIAKGKLAAVDSQVDTTTGTVKLRAQFDNEKLELFPNELLKVRLLVNTLRHVVLIPTEAVPIGPDFSFVYAVKSDNTVEVRTIKPGQSEIINGQDMTAIDEGLSAGETVVTNGVDKLRRVRRWIQHRGHDEADDAIQHDAPRRAYPPVADERFSSAGYSSEEWRMSPSRPFILRPVATSLLMTGILLVGIVAYRQLPVSALPEVDYPTIQVVTFYPGANPDVMASSVTAPLKRTSSGRSPGSTR